MKKKLFIFLTFILLFFVISILLILIYLSSKLEVTQYTYSSSRVPESFDGFKIVQLSDIHCKSFGKDNQELIDQINALEPDIILITGDSIDAAHQDLTPLDNLFCGIKDIAPIYAISGNHEFEGNTPYDGLMALYSKYGIYNLDDQKVLFSKEADSIELVGIDGYNMKANWDHWFLERQNPEVFSILLNHYPGQITKLVQYRYDLLLCGHIHGGIIRIPKLGGLLGTDMTLFPEYDGGEYVMADTTMYVSRGIGDARIPRINNCPEIVCITLKHE